MLLLIAALTPTPSGLDQTALTVIVGSAAGLVLVIVIFVVNSIRIGRERKIFTDLMKSQVAGLNEEQTNFTRSSWLQELFRTRSRVRFNKWAFLTSRFVAVAGALVLPALASQGLGRTPAAAVSVATFAVSVAVAISAGAIQVFKFGNEWALDEEYASALVAEGWAYFQKAGHYQRLEYSAPAFQQFFERIENLRRFRGDRRVADIRNMASEASKEPATPAKSGQPEDSARPKGQATDPTSAMPALPTFDQP